VLICPQAGACNVTESFFRQEALDAVNSIEALPHTLTVTGPLTRQCVCGLVLALAGGVVWSAYVSVPIQISGHGVLVDRSGTLVAPITTQSEGYVAEVVVTVGDVVAAGQPLIRLRFPAREFELRKARGDLDAARRTAERKQVLRAAEAASDEQSYPLKVSALDTRTAGLERRIGWLNRRATDLEGLQAKGDTSTLAVINARVSAEEAADQLAQAQAERVTLDTLHTQSAAQREREALADKLEIEKLEQEHARLADSLANDAVLRGDSSGRVVNVNTRSGALVAPGQVVVDVLTAATAQSGALEAVVFVPMAAGKRVKPGDRTLVTPASLPEGSHDRLVATVLSVSDIPASLASLRSMLGNDELATKSVEGGPPFAVRLALDMVPGQPGYAWTSARAPTVSLTPGTPLSARVTVEHTPLLALAVPALKRLIGLATDDWVDKY
jgi:NHLM bacteriocin system secretion protein